MSPLDFQNTQAIIFVVDSNDRDRLDEAQNELMTMLNEEELKDALLLVFANKRDLSNALSATEISDKLGLSKMRNRSWFVQESSATEGRGLFEGLEWLSSNIKNRIGK